MSRKLLVFFLLFLLCLAPVSRLWAQTDGQNLGSHQFDMTDFPQWARDLRRGEIVAFGSFPLLYLFTNLGIGLAGVDQATSMTIGMAAAGSIVLAIVDYGIERHKRKVRNREAMTLGEGVPIITITPLFDEEGDPAITTPAGPEAENP